MNPNFHLYSIDRLENEMEIIDLGTLERTQNVNFGAKIAGEFGFSEGFENNTSESNVPNLQSSTEQIKNAYDKNGNLIGTFKETQSGNINPTNSNSTKSTASGNQSIKAEVDYSNAENIKENLAIKLKRIKTGFSFTDKKLTIGQRGRPLSDISDNVIVTATIKVRNSSVNLNTKRISKFDKLYSTLGVLNPIKDISISTQHVHYMPCSNASNIQLKMEYEGAIRGVKNQVRGVNNLEYDDKVIYYTFESQPSNLSNIEINKSEFCHEVYKIEATFNNDNDTYILCYSRALPEEVLVYSEHNLYQFRTWLYEIISTGKRTHLVSNKHNLIFVSNKDINKQIPLSKAAMSDNELGKLRTLKNLIFEIRKT